MIADLIRRVYRNTTKIALVCCLVEVGFVATLATGLRLTGQGWLGLTCIGFSSYGFPFAWRTIWNDCGYGISVDKTAFALDVLFYAIIGYGSVFLFEKRRPFSRFWRKANTLSPVGSTSNLLESGERTMDRIL